MAETQTPNYKWTKPDIGGDASTWGNVLNTTFDAIDSVAWANQQAGAPIGSITMFGGATAPTNWLFCNGAVYLDTDIPALVPILNKRFGGSDASHTALPQLNARSPVGSDFGAWAMGAMGGEYNHQLSWSEMPTHNHSASQDAHVHAAWQDGHNHSNWQDAHAHTVAQGTHAHNIVTGNHAHNITTGAHAHNYSQWSTSGGTAVGIASTSYFQQNVTATTTTAGNLGGGTDTAGTLGGYTDQQYPNVGNTDTRQPGVYSDVRQPGVYTDSRAPNVYTGNAGGGATHNNMPPYTVVGFIIRYK